MTIKDPTKRGYVRADQPRLPDGKPDWSVIPTPHGIEPTPRPSKGSPGKRADLRLARAKVAEQAIRMRLAGHTYKQIAETLGWHNESNCYRSIWSYVDRYVPREDGQKMREIEGQRYDQMTALLWSRLGPNSTDTTILAVCDRLLRISEHRRRLWGLDLAPPDVVLRGGENDGDGLDPQREAAERGFENLPLAERQDLWRRLTAVHAEAEVIETRPAGLPAGDGEE